jgi:apolipoprotein N-acyltransferase
MAGLTGNHTITTGSTVAGAILSVACQSGSFLVLNVVGAIFHLGWMPFLWSIPQWLFVVPLFRGLKQRQQDRTARALLMTSALGTMLNAGFVWLAIDVLNHLE